MSNLIINRNNYYSNNNDERNITVLEILKNTFGFHSFRPNQEKIINKILCKKDVFAVMPTGSGKSLCYWLPAVMMEGTAIIISPLISLMKDQVDSAVDYGIKAAFINSSQSFQEMNDVFYKLVNNNLDLLYIAPERFAIENFMNRLKQIKISFFAIDEAHCISEWGHDFRPDYLNLSKIKSNFANTFITAFTATATHKVQEDIIKKLNLLNPFIVRASFDRPNLFYNIIRKTDEKTQIMHYLNKHKNESGIIYRTTRDAVEKMTAFLKSYGIKALSYHAGLSNDERKINQEKFNKDEVDVMVATIAFGMGIDKSNVRFVIHADLPKNIEGYYQETGRAGRDGEPAECIFYFSMRDYPKIKYFIENIQNENESNIAEEKLNQMIKFAQHNVCRRKQLLKYFGENYNKANCESCDICTNNDEKVDITIDSQKILSAIKRTGERFGINHIIDIVYGSDTKKIRDINHDKIKTFGIGNDKTKKYWHFIIDELLAQNAVCQLGDRYPVINITKFGNDILFGKNTIKAVKNNENNEKIYNQNLSYDPVIFERLKTLRKELAAAHGMPPYIVFSDKTLHEMSTYYPTDKNEMREINGVGETKLEQYCNDFIEIIKKYLDENNDIIKPVRETIFTEIKPKLKIGETVDITENLYNDGCSVKEIALKRNLKETTIIKHLIQLIQEGKVTNKEQIINMEKYNLIKNEFIKLKSIQLTPVIINLENKVTYDEARIVRAFMQKEKE